MILSYQSCRTKAIILKIVGFGESDKIVTLYSPDIGRATAIAKGAKRSKRRFVNKLEEFSLLDITYRPGKNNRLHFLREAELDNAFLSLRADCQRYGTAMLACELIIRFTGEHDPDEQVFSLLLWLLESVHQGAQPLSSAALFHLRLLAAVGYQPQLRYCVACKCLPDKNNLSFALQPGSGTLICARCNCTAIRSRFSLSLQTIKFLQAAQQMEADRLERLQMPKKVALESLYVLYQYSRHLLQRDIHSWKFIAVMSEESRRFYAADRP
ncbi:MAG: DNA repair protein RecO [Candidatus Electrothrix sp. AR4]|nr:DNA repair protein RecO [Candidatus Electrothrix sp. AR4]